MLSNVGYIRGRGQQFLVAPSVFRSPLSITRAQLAGVQSSAVNGANNGLTLYGADVPRFNGPAQRLLIEEQTINRVQQPVLVSNPTGAWSQLGGTATPTLTRDFSVSPSGLQDAARVRWVGPNTGNVSLRVPTSGVPTGTTCTISFWVFTRSLANATDATVDLMDGAASANILSQFVLNQWSRVVVAGVVSGTIASSQWVDLNFSGFTTGEIDFDYWGIQVEERSFATSLVLPPVATPGASTRGPDLVSAPLASLGISGNGACTVLFRGLCPVNVSLVIEGQVACISDGSFSNFARLVITGAAGSGQLVLARRTAGVDAIAVLAGGSRPTGSLFSCGVSFHGTGRVTGVWNGSPVAELLGAPTSGYTTMDLFHLRGILPLICEVQKTIVMPYALSDVNLQAAVNGFT